MDINVLEGEKWCQVEGYPNNKVSTFGRVYSKYKDGIMKLQVNYKGYPMVELRKDGSRKMISAHRLVAITFIPNPHNYPQVNHKNGIKTDNRVENLEWCDGFMNMKHAFKTGLQCNQGEKHPRVRLSRNDVFEIRKLREAGITAPEIAKRFSITSSYVYDISYRKAWSHV